MLSYEDSYLGRMRKLIGTEKMFAIAARAIIRDEMGRVLFVRRSDNGKWVMPAGSIELGESILDCVRREVKEESGLDVIPRGRWLFIQNLVFRLLLRMVIRIRCFVSFLLWMNGLVN